jgi:hypothetical protein
MSHCVHRIAQLRTSYFQQHGWPREGERDDTWRFGPLAGELAFVIRKFAQGPDQPLGPLRLRAVDVDDDGVGVWHFHLSGSTLTLDVSRTDLGVGDGAHVERARLLARREGRQIVALHQGVDCLFLISAPVGIDAPRLQEPVAGVDSWEEALVEAASGPWQRVLAATAALTQRYPWHRRAWAVGAASTLGAGAATEARRFALAGLARCPDDPALQLLVGLATAAERTPAASLDDLRAACRRLPRDAETDAVLLAAEGFAARPGWLLATVSGPRGADKRVAIHALAWRGVGLCAAVLGIVAVASGGVGVGAAAFSFAGLTEVTRRVLARARWEARVADLGLDQPIRVLRRFGRARDLVRDAN